MFIYRFKLYVYVLYEKIKLYYDVQIIEYSEDGNESFDFCTAPMYIINEFVVRL